MAAVEKKSSSLSGDDPLSMGRQWVELNKHRVKIKKKVDTKASKGKTPLCNASHSMSPSPPLPIDAHYNIHQPIPHTDAPPVACYAISGFRS